MPMLGSYGDIVFEHSANNVRDFSDMAITTSARWPVSEPAYGMVRPQYSGAGQSEATFDMHIHAHLGVNVPEMLKTVAEKLRNGMVAPLILGDEPIHDHDWLFEQMEEKHIRRGRDGAVIYAVITATLKEYN